MWSHGQPEWPDSEVWAEEGCVLGVCPGCQGSGREVGVVPPAEVSHLRNGTIPV